MESTGADEIPRDNEAEGFETTIEIKIKTLDSQTYTLRVDKELPVPLLKEQIASVTGVLSEQQRLICRGKVLKDDQLLSAYHVEDGHTLHLVVRQPVPPASEGLPNHPADPASSARPDQHNQVAPSVVIETFGNPDQWDGVPPEISRVVSAVLGSFGISSPGSGAEGVVGERGSERLERTPGVDSTHSQPVQPGMRVQYDRSHSAFGHPTAISLGPLQPPVIPDSLTTLSHYLSHMMHEFGASGRGGENNAQAADTHRTQEMELNTASRLGTIQEGLPTPASLAEVMLSTRQMLVEQAGEHLLQLARQLENQANVTNPSVRLTTQSIAWRSGVLFQNLGAFLLELGRATMTLRLGSTPSEAMVNAGPAVFISPSGPNPLMVQPLPFQPGASFGPIPTGNVQPGSGLSNRLGTGFLPRHIEIQIRRGSSTITPNVNQEERGNSQQPLEQRNPATSSDGENVVNQATLGVSEGPSFTTESGVRVMPIRTMVAAVPGPLSHLPSDSASGSLGLYVGRFQHVGSGQVTDIRGSQASGENYPSGFQTEQLPIPESALQQQNSEDPAGDGSLPTPNLGQQEPSHSRRFNVGILSTGGTQNNQESEREVPSSVLQFLRNLFPGGQIRVNDASIQGTATGSATEHEERASSVEDVQEAGASEEGIFLSNLLHQIMPFITQNAEPSDAYPEEANASEHGTAQDSSTQAENSDVGTSGQESSRHTDSPNSKRQKME